MSTAESVLSDRPWYREPWPWILMAGPAAVVVAGIITVWLAVSSADGLVAEDYYKQGLAINRVMAREEAARSLGRAAQLEPAPGRLRLRLAGAPSAQPPALFVQLAHATRAGHDMRLRLARAADGRYEGALPPLPPGRWRVSIEDPQASWRIAGTWSGALQPFTLGAPPAAARAR
jgi:hypothetical protein